MTGELSSTQCRMARAALRWTVDDLAAAADVGRATIIRFENGDDIKASTAAKMREAFEAKHVKFVETGRWAGSVSYFGVAGASKGGA